MDLNNNFVQLRLRYVEAYSDEQVLEAKNKTIIRRKAEKEREIEGREFSPLYRCCEDQLTPTVIRVYTNSKRETRALKQSLDEMIADLTADERDLIAATPPEKKLEDVEDEIQIESSRLGLIHEGNPNAIRLYEERAVKIKNLQEKVSKMEASLEERIEKIDKVRRVWEPRLEALAAKISTAFSYNFRKIGCVGEVRLAKSEEGFDKWALDILVKFRESEKLKILDDQRQSGGERAVSTVFYLMALQSMAQSPFRVVDEINQGMDPRNERVVHHRMVNVACQEHTSQ